MARAMRRRGHATGMVHQALGFCRGLGLDRVLVTCADTNAPSWRIIAHFGGRLEDRVWDETDRETISRDWIALPQG